MRLNYSLLKEVFNELNDKIINNHFSHVTVINSSDIFMQFSFYTKEKLFISLNHTNPVISLIPKEFNTPTVMGGLSENLRKYIKGTYITKIELVNEDRIIMFTLQKTDEFYEKSILHLIIELIPTRTNLIITDDSGIILFAHHYADITHTRPIVKGLKYEPIEKHNSVQNEPADLEMYKESVLMLLSEAKSKRQKETQKPLYDYLNTKKKSLERKLKVLDKEIIEAKKDDVYREYGETIYSYSYDNELLNKYIQDELKDVYDPLLTINENANKFFKRYKKSKRTIEMDLLEKEKTRLEIEEITFSINSFAYLNEDELNELYNKYFAHKLNKPKKVKTDKKMPFYVEYNGVLIGFGKNAQQNEYLTFKKAHKENIFLHIDKSSGSHVVIFDDHPTNEVMLVASEIALILSNEIAGDIKYCPIKEIKKGNYVGNVLINSYKLISLRSVRESTYSLLSNQKRFDK